MFAAAVTAGVTSSAVRVRPTEILTAAVEALRRSPWPPMWKAPGPRLLTVLGACPRLIVEEAVKRNLVAKVGRETIRILLRTATPTASTERWIQHFNPKA